MPQSPERNRISCKAYYQRNREKILEKRRRYYASNAHVIKARVEEYSKNNPHKVNAKQARRRATKLQATPGWASKELIETFYKVARLLSMYYGREVTVDHIVPLQGELVCGLHCEANLQLMFGTDNKSKGNYWDVNGDHTENGRYIKV